ncbi:DUF4224 domain-containing protein [Ferriphaselus sp. R-1]|uniref:DUF4224 domain-containing protein n=1 Tax=Ferriphaselus sp. R-1 TaxID=1485544 RepID=UPI00054EAB17|nr:DUF4224 domain-containing protein [Ferriphaselus sp. R-1]
MKFLSQAELAELTERKTKARQIAWLKLNGYKFAIGANGSPKVLLEHAQAKLGGFNQAIPKMSANIEPNWSAV